MQTALRGNREHGSGVSHHPRTRREEQASSNPNQPQHSVLCLPAPPLLGWEGGPSDKGQGPQIPGLCLSPHSHPLALLSDLQGAPREPLLGKSGPALGRVVVSRAREGGGQWPEVQTLLSPGPAFAPSTSLTLTTLMGFRDM